MTEDKVQENPFCPYCGRVKLSMSLGEFKLLEYWLNRACREFSDHGCNDFNMDKVLTPEERTQFIMEVNALPRDAGDPPFEDSPTGMPDWVVIEALLRRLNISVVTGYDFLDKYQ